MIEYEYFVLSNGLQIILHNYSIAPILNFNLTYQVGSKHEYPNNSGVAHFLEHMMFEGHYESESYDEIIESIGGNNNAFTSSDITNYYSSIPSVNLETLCWIESRRMIDMNFLLKDFEVQKKVILEEYKESYLTKPYGDAWHKILSIAYTKHPYRFPVIGRDIESIKDISIEDIRNFYNNYYSPNNAILVIAGSIDLAKTRDLVTEYFGKIPSRNIANNYYPQEPKQKSHRKKTTKGKVPMNAFYKVYHCPPRNNKDYYAAYLIANYLFENGKSSYLYRKLVETEKVFYSINCFMAEFFDNDILVIYGKIYENIDMNRAEKLFDDTIQGFIDNELDEKELKKSKTRAHGDMLLNYNSLSQRSLALVHSSAMNNVDLVNTFLKKMESIRLELLQRVYRSILHESNCSTLYYEKI